MSVCPITAVAPVQPGADLDLLAQRTPCDEKALEQLTADFESKKPVAIVVGPGRARTRKVVDRFLTSRNDKTCCIRISDPCVDHEALLKTIIEQIGFTTKALELRDLDNILKMFLAFQRTHRRRTVLCLENAEECASGALGKLFEYIDIETEESFGLFVVIAGHEELDRRMQQGALRAIAGRAGQPIPVSPLARNETRCFVMDQIEAQNFDDATIVIEPEAIERMHYLSGGICDTVNGLCDKSLEMAADESGYPITTGLIDKAAVELGLLHAEIEAVPHEQQAAQNQSAGAGKLKLFCRGQYLSEVPLTRDVVRIGRHKRNDLCLPSLLVSRYHALLTIGEGGIKIADLGSSNGTIVNGNQVKSRVLVNGDTILIGDYRAEYVSAESATNAIVAAEIMALSQKRDDTERQLPAVGAGQA